MFEAVVIHGRMLADQGFEPVLFALRDSLSASDGQRFAGAVHTFDVVGPAAVGFAPGILPALKSENLDVLHLHGIWMYPSHAAVTWAQHTGKPYVVSPHGMLDPWILSRGRWKKSVAKLGYEHRSWHRADLFHALTPAEAVDVRRETKRVDIAVIPNAVPVSHPVVSQNRANRILYLGRIHPKKNIEGLVRAWAALEGKPFGWKLIIAGWGEADHVSSLEGLLADIADPSIEFIGPVYETAKAQELSSAKFFVLPSFSEGLPLAILEAWAAGLPTIQSDGCNLPEGFTYEAAICTGTDHGSIRDALREAITMPEGQHDRMSRNASRLIDEKFSIQAVTQAWSGEYRRLFEQK